jgi:hypothetical protein
MNITLTKGHPFFDKATVSVWQQDWNQKWTVRWRDFYSVKQDMEFDSEAEAREFAATVNVPPLTIEGDELCGYELAECDEFWRRL